MVYLYLKEIFMRIMYSLCSIVFSYYICNEYVEEILFLCLKSVLFIFNSEEELYFSSYNSLIDVINKIIAFLMLNLVCLQIILHLFFFFLPSIKKVYVYYSFKFLVPIIVFFSLYYLVIKKMYENYYYNKLYNLKNNLEYWELEFTDTYMEYVNILEYTLVYGSVFLILVYCLGYIIFLEKFITVGYFLILRSVFIILCLFIYCIGEKDFYVLICSYVLLNECYLVYICLLDRINSIQDEIDD